jgi:hypothetical protein
MENKKVKNRMKEVVLIVIIALCKKHLDFFKGGHLPIYMYFKTTFVCSVQGCNENAYGFVYTDKNEVKERGYKIY